MAAVRPAPGTIRDLAGLNAAYLQKQLDDFAGGTRASPMMQATAKALSEDERETLAAYATASCRFHPHL